MLLFIWLLCKWERDVSEISIHLMLLFIIQIRGVEQIKMNFNTSHVTVYRKSLGLTQQQQSYFNTSHVTVYQSGQNQSV